jgi:hypothetical protein
MSDEKNSVWSKGAPPQNEGIRTAAASAPLEQSPEAQAVASSPDSDVGQIISGSVDSGSDNHDQGQDENVSPPASGLHGESIHQHQKARDQDVLPEILGRQLRAAYGELLSTPLPDSITDLVRKLERRQPTSTSANKAKQPSGKESR